MNKRAGDEKYYILISLIVGIMILAIVLFFIFKEYFNDDDLNWEACRQSIVMRASVPGYSALDGTKSLLPLKCKTQVFNVKYQDRKKFMGDIQKLVTACESLTGSGNYKIFPDEWFKSQAKCFPCVRVHIDESVKSFYRNQPDLIVYYRYESNDLPRWTQLLFWDQLEQDLKEGWHLEGGFSGNIMISTLDEFVDLTSSNQCQLEGVPA